MSVAAIVTQAGRADQFVLRWSESPESPVREEPVEIIGSNFSESVIRSALRISEQTKVYLIGNHYTGNGIVRSCQQEGTSFLVTILISSESSGPEWRPEYDPGLFAVNEFLTEEEEAKILEGLQTESSFRQKLISMIEVAGGVFRKFLLSLRLALRAGTHGLALYPIS